jgi:hypothetical protein
MLFLLPDLTMLGCLRSPAIGAMIYNAGHCYISSVLLAVVGLIGGLSVVEPHAIIWMAHIAFDRLLGFGLKYTDRFAHTHLIGHGGAASA